MKYSLLAGLSLATLAYLSFAGCETVTFAGDGTAPGVSLAGRKTFTVMAPVNAGQNPILSAGVTSDAVVKNINTVMTARGYEFKEAGPADITVISSWTFSIDTNSNYTSGQIYGNGGPPQNPGSVGLSIRLRDGATNKLLWSGDSPFPVPAASMTPGTVTSLVGRALDQLPKYQPASADAPPAAAPAASPPAPAPAAAPAPTTPAAPPATPAAASAPAKSSVPAGASDLQ